MIIENMEKVIRECIERYGEDKKSCMATEECAELIQAINKVKRKIKENKEAIDNLIEEISDVEIMIEQLKIMYGIDDGKINQMMMEKLERQLDRMLKE